MQRVLHCSAPSATAGDVTAVLAGLPRACVAPALGNCPGKRKGQTFFLLRIRPVNMQCLHSSDKVFPTSILKGSQSSVSCFVLLVERPMYWGSNLAEPSTRPAASIPNQTPLYPHFTIGRCYSIKTLGCHTTIFTQPGSSEWLGIQEPI